MKFHRTSATSSRVTKPSNRKKSLFQTSKKSSPAPSLVKTPSSDSIEPHGKIKDHKARQTQLAPGLESSTVESIMRYFQDHMFSAVPNKSSGMNSMRVADILNHRAQFPPLVPVAHIHALSASPTSADREIAVKIQAGVIRRVIIPRRGSGSSAIGEALVLTTDWEQLLDGHPEITDDLKVKYLARLKETSSSLFSAKEIQTLTRIGLLTSPSTNQSQAFLSQHSTSLGTLTNLAEAGFRHASGSEASSGGIARDHASGGSRSARVVGLASNANNDSHVLSLPNTGSFLKLLSTARARLLQILVDSGPYKAMSLDRLRERWDGSAIEIGDILGDSGSPSLSRFKGVLPGKTKKWKECYGISFEWILAEAVGAGVVECFSTGSVGTGVRVV